MNNSSLKKIINNLSSGIGATMVAISVHSYYLTLKDQRVKDNLSKTLDIINENQIIKAQNYYNGKINLSEIDQKQLVNELINIKERLGMVQKAMDKYEEETSIGQKVMDLFLNTRPDFSSMINKIPSNDVLANNSQPIQQTITNQPITKKVLNNLEEYRKSFEAQSSLDESIKEKGFINNNLSETAREYNNKIEPKLPSSSTNYETIISNNNLIDEVKEFLKSYQEWVNSLSIIKQGAIIHILTSSIILINVISLMSVFYGDSLIKYFKIEEKYPRIAKFIQLRRKFQQYYFFISILWIFLSLVTVLIFNLWLFLFID
jgi:hypothetical protein